MSRETDALTGLLPSMTRLSTTLSGGQLFEWATADEQRGLVTRVPDQDDQRVRLITPTAEGERLVGGYLRVITGWFTAALAGWSDPDRRDPVRLVADPSAYPDTVVGGEH
ncbi:MAG TPA: hypothetical protein VGG05_14300 [Pseudonocardiaceae bacterium]